jgi:hypothetical protein
VILRGPADNKEETASTRNQQNCFPEYLSQCLSFPKYHPTSRSQVLWHNPRREGRLWLLVDRLAKHGLLGRTRAMTCLNLDAS